MIATLLLFQNYSSEDKADLVLTDLVGNRDVLFDRISKCKIFDHIYKLDCASYLTPKSFRSTVEKIKFLVCYKHIINNMIKDIPVYDEMYFNGEDIFSFNFITFLKEQNRECKICRYEEGYSSYTRVMSSSERSKKMVHYRNKLYRNNIDMVWDYFYVFEPQLLEFNNTLNIKLINRKIALQEKYKDIISKIFNTYEVNNTYNRNFIIFEESFFTDGFVTDDIELYKKIIEILGSENVTIKLHPRTKINRFSGFGVDVHELESVPWEAIVLTKNLSNVILITLASGSVINSRLLLGDNSKALLLYNCLNKKPPILDDSFNRFIKNFHNLYPNGLYMPDDIDTTIAVIKELIVKN